MSVDFVHVTTIDAPRDVVFGLSLDIDAHLASMADSGERAIRGVTSGPIGLGEEVTWRATHFGIPFTMTSRVTELARPGRFVDEQVSGPFRRFRHTHEFHDVDGSTEMVDTISFAAPLGVIGVAVERVLLDRYLRRLIAQRGAYIEQAAEAVAARQRG